MGHTILNKKFKFRSVFISDIHLGFHGCNADLLLSFLRHVECEYLYLVGDIIDIWSLKRKRYWPQNHNNVVRTILGKAKHDTKVIYVPGNHDELLKTYNDMVFGNITINTKHIHTTVNGKKYLITHGDEFDQVVKYSKWLAKVGSKLYDWLLSFNSLVTKVRNFFKLNHWSLSAFIKYRVKNAVSYIGSYEKALAYTAQKNDVDGIICGHIHHPEVSIIKNIEYCNCGDWVESCTALIEDFDGNIKLIEWGDLIEMQDQKNQDYVDGRTA